MTDVVVSGAGITDVNGTWKPYGDFNGKTAYYADWYIGDEWSEISWQSSQWQIWYNGNLIYYSTDDVATPDLVTTWVIGDAGIAPLPTVTAAGGDPPSSIINHIMHYRRLMSV